jgi:hypothetical protein
MHLPNWFPPSEMHDVRWRFLSFFCLGVSNYRENLFLELQGFAISLGSGAVRDKNNLGEVFTATSNNARLVTYYTSILNLLFSDDSVKSTAQCTTLRM